MTHFGGFHSSGSGKWAPPYHYEITQGPQIRECHGFYLIPRAAGAPENAKEIPMRFVCCYTMKLHSLPHAAEQKQT